ncbi:hypothetical protein GCM10009601_44900 [Streptomyces thermospinosisporus]|uniref:Twin-arginine translocation signal domain-containing protein n=1 Tax=Streptomyces thermospinosisporus TaxID=161482 RepID=A0ABN1Z304_9ACTN
MSGGDFRRAAVDRWPTADGRRVGHGDGMENTAKTETATTAHTESTANPANAPRRKGISRAGFLTGAAAVGLTAALGGAAPAGGAAIRTAPVHSLRDMMSRSSPGPK